MITTRKEFNLCLAHRLLHHKGKCANLHGHNYRVSVTFASIKGLNKDGMVLDFSDAKEIVGGFLECFFDHTVLVWREDRELLGILLDLNTKYFIFEENPTAENMAKFILNYSFKLPENIYIAKVCVEETPGSTATAVLGK